MSQIQETPAAEGMTYASVGVDYDALDEFKRLAQEAGLETAKNIADLGFRELEWTRGESVHLIDTGSEYSGHVLEGLGTKGLITDEMYRLTGKSYYYQIAQDALAMIVNDLITLGTRPVSLTMYLAVGNSDWFNDRQKIQDLIKGWKDASDLAGCNWGGGETPSLKDVIYPNTFDLAGSVTGIIRPKSRLIDPATICEGDAIIFVESSGIHANGLTMARKIADNLDDGYLTKLSDQRTYGETLLDPTHIYVSLVQAYLNSGMKIHYTVNITGHGWRKLMRAKQPFAYVIDRLPKQLEIFEFLQQQGQISNREAYGTFNMGAGFAFYIPQADAESAIAIAGKLGFTAFVAGYIENSEEKKVIIRPKELEYSADTLGVR